jgi:phosphopantothenoylcysteine decarboxylase/phosphopantothenate--cysteine ligase
MGYALTTMARRRGAEVTLVSGPSSLTEPFGVKFLQVSSAEEMRDAVTNNMEDSTVIIKAAAVADFRPVNSSDDKIKKEDALLNIRLERNPDIISEIGRKKGDRILIGFAVETENLIENARNKMVEKNMDLIVVNDVTQHGAGFQTDTNIVKILDREGGVEELPILDKIEVANRILDRIRAIKVSKV